MSLVGPGRLLLAIVLAIAAAAPAAAEPFGEELPLPAEAAGSGLAYGSHPEARGWLTAQASETPAPELGLEVYSTRLSDLGAPFGPIVRVSDNPDVPGGYPHDDTQSPDVVYNSRRHEFLVVWAQGFRIWGQRLTFAGAEIGEAFQISTGVRYDNYRPDAVYNPDRDEYLVVWDDHSENGVDIEMQAFAQRLGAGGERLLAADRQVSSNPTREQAGPACSSFGPPAAAYSARQRGYLVVWSPTWCTGRDKKVVAQRLDALAEQVGPDDFHPAGFDPTASGSNNSPDVASDGAGYLVAWTDRYEIFGQRLSGTGADLGVQDFRISDLGPPRDPRFTARDPRVAHNPVSGQWAVAFSGNDMIGGESKAGLFGQHLASDGREIGLNDFLVSSTGAPEVGPLGVNGSNHEFLFTWRQEEGQRARRVVSAGCAPDAGCPVAASGGSAGNSSRGAGGGASVRQVKLRLGAALRRAALRAANLDLGRLLARRRFVLSKVVAPSAGTFVLELRTRTSRPARAAERITLARGTKKAEGPGPYRVVAKLTRSGRRLLSRLRTARVTLVLSFKPSGARAVTSRRALTLRR